MKVRFADLITLSSAAVSTLSVALYTSTSYDILAVRLLLAAYILDALDGIAARIEGPTREGFMLDRSVDRYNQVVVPIVLLLSTPGSLLVPYTVYAMILVPWAYYRLVYRRVPGREYFYGLPLIAHSLVIVLSLLAGRLPNPLILFILLTASILPIPYYRRPLSRGGESKANRSHISLYDAGRIITLLILALLPRGQVMNIISQVTIYAVIIYALTGYIPILATKREVGGLKSREPPQQ